MELETRNKRSNIPNKFPEVAISHLIRQHFTYPASVLPHQLAIIDYKFIARRHYEMNEYQQGVQVRQMSIIGRNPSVVAWREINIIV